MLSTVPGIGLVRYKLFASPQIAGWNSHSENIAILGVGNRQVKNRSSRGSLRSKLTPRERRCSMDSRKF